MTIQAPSSSGASISIASLLTRGSTQFGLLIILAVLWAGLASLSPGFLSTFNLNSLGRSVAVDVVVGFAQMVVLATGGMNLSVGAIGVCSVMLAGYLLQVLGLPIPLAIAATLAFGGVLGWLNGIAITKTGVNSFVVTLASASLFSGGMLILSHGVPLNGLPPAIGVFGQGSGRSRSSACCRGSGDRRAALHPVRAQRPGASDSCGWRQLQSRGDVGHPGVPR